jgi:dihydroxy-acid dehydratase
MIELDLDSKRLQLLVPDEELSRRREGWMPPPPRVSSGYLARYAALVKDASSGAVLS